MVDFIVYLSVCFVIGSLPVGELIARFKTGKTVLQPGTRSTKSPGETFEILGSGSWVAINIIDALKGFAAVSPVATFVLGATPYQQWWLISLGGFVTVIGHCNSPFLGLKGGRGLSPTFGVMVTLLPYPALVASFIGFFLAFWGLSSKPGALSAAAVMPFLSIFWVLLIKPEDLYFLYIVACMSIWTIWEHRSELKKYLGMTDSKNSETGQSQKEKNESGSIDSVLTSEDE